MGERREGRVSMGGTDRLLQVAVAALAAAFRAPFAAALLFLGPAKPPSRAGRRDPPSVYRGSGRAPSAAAGGRVGSPCVMNDTELEKPYNCLQSVWC